jgi:hypothetical protein
VKECAAYDNRATIQGAGKGERLENMTPASRLTILTKIMEAMGCLEEMPCGGIGANGAPQAELDLASKDGRCAENDAVYHQSQQAWLHLNEALKLL